MSRASVLDRGARLPRAFVAGLLSALVPGAGQLYAGSRRRGLAMLAAAAGIAVLAVGFALQDGTSLLRLAVQPEVLLVLLVLDGLLLAFRAHCALDAYRWARRKRLAAGRRPGPAGGRAVAVGTLLAFIAVPHVYAGYLDWRSYDVLTTVFADGASRDEASGPGWATAPIPRPAPTSRPAVAAPVSAAALAPVASIDPAAPDVGSPGPRADGVPDGASVRGAEPARPEDAPSRPPQPPSEQPAPWDGKRRVTFLLVGADAGPYRYGLRTDTMIVASIDPGTRRTALFGIPRNLSGVPFPPGADTDLETFPDLLNALWGYAEHTPGLFPGTRHPGAAALKRTIGHLLGLRIDYLIAVDLRGFVEVVDALGGVTVNVQRHIWDAGVSPPIEGEPPIAIDLEPGRHTLDGREALAYSRTRWASSDYDRMHRQRCLLGALSRQANPVKLLRALPRLATTIKRFVFTDVPLRELPGLVELLAGLKAGEMVGVSFAPPLYDVTLDTWDTPTDVERMRGTVRAALAGAAGPSPELGVRTVRDDCA